MNIRKAVIPAAGLSTRFLPATKAIPKEMFPIVDWYTNLPVKKDYKNLYKHYALEEYSKYDNSNIINVNRVSQIPVDYYGQMGVPITFLAQYDPEKFEIIGIANDQRYIGSIPWYAIINGNGIYHRILIRQRTIEVE